MPESTQHKLDRVRPPRVQITYDVEIGNAIVKKEIPFVVGILAELSGKNQGILLSSILIPCCSTENQQAPCPESDSWNPLLPRLLL